MGDEMFTDENGTRWRRVFVEDDALRQSGDPDRMTVYKWWAREFPSVGGDDLRVRRDAVRCEDHGDAFMHLVTGPDDVRYRVWSCCDADCIDKEEV